MTSVKRIETFDEFVQLWPRLAKLSDCTDEGYAKTLLNMFLTSFEDGAVFLVRNDTGLVGSCCVKLATPVAVLLSLPRDGGERLGRVCLEAVETWARAQGCSELAVTSSRLCGSSYKYFEKSLGFRRSAVTYKKGL